MKKSRFTARRIALNAVLIALYIVLGFIKIPIGNILRVNMAPFAVVTCAVAFSPIDGLVVGFLGEFLSQVLGPYGLTPTTALWALPEAARGFLLGLSVLLLARKFLDNTKTKTVLLYLICCVITGIIASLLNTFALYVDSKMFGYYNEYMVFGVLAIRLGLSAVMSTLFGTMALTIVAALRRNKIL